MFIVGISQLKLIQNGVILASSEGTTWQERDSNCGMRNTRELIILCLHSGSTEMSGGVFLAGSFYPTYFIHAADIQGSLFPSLFLKHLHKYTHKFWLLDYSTSCQIDKIKQHRPILKIVYFYKHHNSRGRYQKIGNWYFKNIVYLFGQLVHHQTLGRNRI